MHENLRGSNLIGCDKIKGAEIKGAKKKEAQILIEIKWATWPKNVLKVELLGAHLEKKGRQPLSSKRKMNLNSQFALNIPPKNLKWPIIPCIRNHIPSSTLKIKYSRCALDYIPYICYLKVIIFAVFLWAFGRIFPWLGPFWRTIYHGKNVMWFNQGFMVCYLQLYINFFILLKDF